MTTRAMLGAMGAMLVLVGYAWATGTGTVDKVTGWYPAGTNLTVTATPTNIYSQFDRWEGDTNDAAIVDNELSLSIDAPAIITAVFRDAVTASNAVPYAWLNSVNTNLTTVEDFETAVTNDADGDNFTTWQEYLSGTDPYDENSYLHITGVERVGENIRIQWQHAHVSSEMQPVRVEWRTNLLSGAWQHGTNVPPVDGTNTWDDTAPDQRYYRLLVPGTP